MAALMVSAEDDRDKISIILAGYKEDIQKKLYDANPGMASRFTTVNFADYDDEQLAAICRGMAEKLIRMPLEPNVDAVAARWVGQGRGEGFGNARSVRKLLEAAERNARARGSACISVEDAVGREPSREALPALDALMLRVEGRVGQERVKELFRGLLKTAQDNYRSIVLNSGRPPTPLCLNRVFVGNPGTGKTTAAEMYGEMLKILRFVSNGEVVSKGFSDFVGSAVGESAVKTQGLLESAAGKVLLIDEAYGLNDQLYGKQALDTICLKVSGSLGEDRAVVMMGYEGQMKDLFRNQNAGLTRRFQFPDNPVYFDDFTDEELLVLVSNALKHHKVAAPIDVKMLIVKLVARRRSLPNFGNAGAVNSMIADIVQRFRNRAGKEREEGDRLTAADVKPPSAEGDPFELLKKYKCVYDEMRGVEATLRQRVRENRGVEDLGKNYLFMGGAGTGKTQSARLMAKVLHSLGLLASDTLVEVS
jgi:Cdc6-like AAA superfamily ATPase